MALGGFEKNHGPLLPPNTNTLFGNFPPNPNPLSRSADAHHWPQPQPPPPLPLRPSPHSQSRLGTQNDVLFENRISEAPKRMWSPPLAFESNHSAENLHSPHEEALRPDASPPKFGSRRKSPVNDANTLARQRFPSVASHVYINDVGTSSPPMPAKFHASKRTRSPPLRSADEITNGISHSDEVDTEREMQAKAKRLARFHVELSQGVESPPDLPRQKISGSKHSQPPMDKRRFPADDTTRKTGNSFDGGVSSDYEGFESYTVICGLCPDMCPESEREERQRKGDLDKYERLDGERNQTSRSLAVKKYNRTAERDADLIRPLPILRKTVDYLLGLLDQPYGDRFLGMYNFLWDRMRAIRMDLRMQHIFSQDAIIMLEQMIRLHVIAMHELCEYKKGEGFSEGFDAHLNIEQMNKTSVELFQMYDDHRKKGIIVPTEKEFRGYYALLKLDKHPGYRVEPAELSLDLAKMTPEIRCTQEILFARDVARACRTSNFIAFFRLARKATHLQACLMHAHFAKLRTQALASLHSGLQNNQGIPVAHVVEWLGMEGEDIEGLLEYHGFSTKKFEEIYMVKEGPFLNSDMDYLTKCSQLVHLKRSKRIIDDVCCGQTHLRPSEGTKIVSNTIDKFDQRTIAISATEACVNAIDQEMLDYEVDYAPKSITQPQTMLVWPSPTILESNGEDKVADVYPRGVSYGSVDDSLGCHTLPSDYELLSESGGDISMNGMPVSNVTESLMQTDAPRRSNSVKILENSVPQQVVTTHTENGNLMLMLHEEDEAASARMKLIIRTWKRHSSKKREIREERRSLANAALSSLSLGPPVRQNEFHPGHAGDELNINYMVRERDGRREKSWSKLNVSEVVGPILSTRNPQAKCLCWKLVFCLQINDRESKTNQLASLWLLAKLVGTGRENDDELVVSSLRLSIWKKLIGTQVGFPLSCCYSVIREVVFDDNRPVASEDIMVGLSAVMFLVSESIPWEIQKVRLHNLLKSIPSGSCLPLLILSTDAYKKGIADPFLIINSLGLQELDKTVINNYSVVFLGGNCPLKQTNGFFSDDHLKCGLQWLANQSPLQPSLRQVKTRDLILSYLKSSLATLENAKFSEVAPDHCISTFNEALDHSTEEIRIAADMNKNCWPSPEINMLEELSYECRAVNMFLPSTGWSSASRIEPIIKAIKSCKLPSFPNDLSWLNRGSDMGRDMPSQKKALEECLFSYLTKSARLLSSDLAVRETSVMLQNGSGLELHGSYYYLIPRWAMIFRRIYNWRLTSLSSGEFADAFVLETGVPGRGEQFSSGDVGTFSKSDMGLKDWDDNLGFEVYRPSHSALNHLSLDEMVEICCSSIPSGHQLKSVCEPSEAPEGTPDAVTDVSDIDTSSQKSDEDLRFDEISESRDGVSLPVERNNQTRLVAEGHGSDKLGVLLEQWNKLQNMIDEKLAIYF